MSDNSINKLANNVHDQELIEYFYLNLNLDQLLKKIESLSFEIESDKKYLPFNAEVKAVNADRYGGGGQ